jgi:hypothetical protein
MEQRQAGLRYDTSERQGNCVVAKIKGRQTQGRLENVKVEHTKTSSDPNLSSPLGLYTYVASRSERLMAWVTLIAP